jgi:metallophosphoesterase superfamily enzyme
LSSPALLPCVSETPADVAFARRAAYLREPDALVVADVHLGRGRESRVEFPVEAHRDAEQRLTGAIDRFDPETVVVAGDLLHSFDRLPPTVADAAADLAAAVADAGADLVVTPGNHDARLSTALADTGAAVPTPSAHRLGDGTVVGHGHEAPPPGAQRYVVGHDHPAITIEGQRHPCFLYGDGTYRGADVLVLPAFDPLARGVAVDGVAGADLLSPVLSGGVDDYRPIVYDHEAGEALAFPPLKNLREHL